MWIIAGILLAVIIVIWGPQIPWLPIAAAFYLISNFFAALVSEIHKRIPPSPPR